ncbi:acetyltransferase [Pseudomonas lini]|uniref:Acetyltransferase n=1 Tax=Pseudomonas lini TaxID=163011 RepID=A0A1H1WDY1_9PSED|nr:acetyltransferase [Pseudomonas lini]KAB0508738.1 acetyltransferase [Pseudomonas lini]SDS95224.1 transferase hexapeptide (six repeat-containing protein) [Pseudomonas lini]
MNNQPIVVPNGLLIIGFGGHARSVADVALSIGVKSLCFIDENARDGEEFCSFPVKKMFDFDLGADWAAFPASGDNHKRAQQFQWLQSRFIPIATLISSRATIGVGSVIGAGSFIGHHAHIGPMAEIGTGCIINTGAIVEHECVIEEFCHVSVGSTIAGRSTLGARGFIGAGATVIDAITIVSDVTIGAGGCVPRHLTESGVYTGVPVRRVRR